MFAKFSTLALLSLWLSYVSALKLSVEPSFSRPEGHVTIKFTSSEGDPTKVDLFLERNQGLYHVSDGVTVAPTVEVTIPPHVAFGYERPPCEHPRAYLLTLLTRTYRFAATYVLVFPYPRDFRTRDS
ncbi:hypothetical protein V8E55_008297 [Tylopilus felleus]